MLTPEQLAKRKLGIGGSDAAAVGGKCPWRTPVELYLELTDDPDYIPQEEKPQFWWGNELEPVILRAYERQMDERCLTYEDGTACFFTEHHPVYTWMRANIDGYIFNKNIIVECKTASHYTMHLWGDPGTNQMPINYLWQCAHYAIVYDAKRVDLAVLFGANDFRIYHYERDAVLEQEIIEAERYFWHEYYLKKICPTPLNLEDCTRLWPESFEKTKTITADLYVDLLQLASTKARIKELEMEEDILKLRIQQDLQDCEALVDNQGNRLVTWKNQSSKRLEIETFKKNYPNIYAQHLKESSSRVFRLGKVG